MASESRTVSISFSEIIGADRLCVNQNSPRAPLLWGRQLGRNRILQVVFGNERLGNVHALGRIQNRRLAAIDDQGNSVSFSVGIERLAHFVLERQEQILLALLI